MPMTQTVVCDNCGAREQHPGQKPWITTALMATVVDEAVAELHSKVFCGPDCLGKKAMQVAREHTKLERKAQRVAKPRTRKAKVPAKRSAVKSRRAQ